MNKKNSTQEEEQTIQRIVDFVKEEMDRTFTERYIVGVDPISEIPSSSGIIIHELKQRQDETTD